MRRPMPAARAGTFLLLLPSCPLLPGAPAPSKSASHERRQSQALMRTPATWLRAATPLQAASSPQRSKRAGPGKLRLAHHGLLGEIIQPHGFQQLGGAVKGPPLVQQRVNACRHGQGCRGWRQVASGGMHSFLRPRIA